MPVKPKKGSLVTTVPCTRFKSKSKVASKKTAQGKSATGHDGVTKKRSRPHVSKGRAGYTLYAADSDVQVGEVDKGLNRCANIVKQMLEVRKGAGKLPKDNLTVKPAVTPGGPVQRQALTREIIHPDNHVTSPRQTNRARPPVVIPTAEMDAPSPQTKGVQSAPLVTHQPRFNNRLSTSTPDPEKMENGVLNQENAVGYFRKTPASAFVEQNKSNIKPVVNHGGLLRQILDQDPSQNAGRSPRDSQSYCLNHSVQQGGSLAPQLLQENADFRNQGGLPPFNLPIQMPPHNIPASYSHNAQGNIQKENLPQYSGQTSNQIPVGLSHVAVNSVNGQTQGAHFAPQIQSRGSDIHPGMENILDESQYQQLPSPQALFQSYKGISPRTLDVPQQLQQSQGFFTGLSDGHPHPQQFQASHFEGRSNSDGYNAQNPQRFQAAPFNNPRVQQQLNQTEVGVHVSEPRVSVFPTHPAAVVASQQRAVTGENNYSSEKQRLGQIPFSLAGTIIDEPVPVRDSASLYSISSGSVINLLKDRQPAPECHENHSPLLSTRSSVTDSRENLTYTLPVQSKNGQVNQDTSKDSAQYVSISPGATCMGYSDGNGSGSQPNGSHGVARYPLYVRVDERVLPSSQGFGGAGVPTNPASNRADESKHPVMVNDGASASGQHGVRSVEPVLHTANMDLNIRGEMERALEPLIAENSQLRSELRSVNQQLKDLERQFVNQQLKEKEKEHVKEQCKEPEGVQVSKDLEKDLQVLTLTQDKVKTLEKAVEDEKCHSDELQMELRQCQRDLDLYKTDRQKLLAALAERDSEKLHMRQGNHQEVIRLRTEVQLQQKQAESYRLKLDASEKETHILAISLKQRDAEIDRLQEVVQAMKKSMSELMQDPSRHAGNSQLSGSFNLQRLERLLRDGDINGLEFDSHSEITGLPENGSPLEAEFAQLTVDALAEHNERSLVNRDTNINKPMEEFALDDKVSQQNRFEEQVSKHSESATTATTTEEDFSSVSTVKETDQLPSQSPREKNPPPKRVQFQLSVGESPAAQISANEFEDDSTVVSDAASRFSVTDYFKKYPGGTPDSGINATNKKSNSVTLPDKSLNTTAQESSSRGVNSVTTNENIPKVQRQSATTTSVSGSRQTQRPLRDPFQPQDEDLNSVTSGVTFSSVSTLATVDESVFREGLANLDANIARLQESLSQKKALLST